jgi:hypothetical protein
LTTQYLYSRGKLNDRLNKKPKKLIIIAIKQQAVKCNKCEMEVRELHNNKKLEKRIRSMRLSYTNVNLENW